jgi:hypothetical protein
VIQGRQWIGSSSISCTPSFVEREQYQQSFGRQTSLQLNNIKISKMHFTTPLLTLSMALSASAGVLPAFLEERQTGCSAYSMIHYPTPLTSDTNTNIPLQPLSTPVALAKPKANPLASAP